MTEIEKLQKQVEILYKIVLHQFDVARDLSQDESSTAYFKLDGYVWPLLEDLYKLIYPPSSS